MTLGQTVSIGVATGCGTTAVLYMLALIFRRIVLPWYQGLIYSGVDISGEWKMPLGQTAQEALYTFKQKASRLTGAVTFVGAASSGSVAELSTYDLSGRVSERFVQFDLRKKDRRSLGIASYLFEIVEDGRKMRGHGAVYSIATTSVTSHPCELVRKEDVTPPAAP